MGLYSSCSLSLASAPWALLGLSVGQGAKCSLSRLLKMCLSKGKVQITGKPAPWWGSKTEAFEGGGKGRPDLCPLPLSAQLSWSSSCWTRAENHARCCYPRPALTVR